MIVLDGLARDLGDGFKVRRVLPQAARKSVGPFVFFDHFGPVDFAPGKGVDVRPHPHIGLATVTYLFEGSQMHRDSLGFVQEITPGAVNWMTAGRGIVHSERTGPETRATGHRLHGIQSWVGLPQSDQEAEPGFQHIPAANLPTAERDGATLRLITGTAYGLASPVRAFSDIFYVDAKLAAGAALPVTDEHVERAVFVVEGTVEIAGARREVGDMAVLDAGEKATISAASPARVMLLGGAPLDGHRHVWWNFVSSSADRIEQAKADWKAGRFGRIPGETEFIPLPE